MTAPDLNTDIENLFLVKPDIERDPLVSLLWVNGNNGQDTLLRMGIPENKITGSTLEEEVERVANFIHGKEQLNWMIKCDEKIVGSIWVELIEKDSVKAPSVHLMIGNPSVRRNGIGKASLKAVIDYLQKQDAKIIYSRHLISNKASEHLLGKVGFIPEGKVYTDDEELSWQNVSLAV